MKIRTRLKENQRTIFSEGEFSDNDNDNLISNDHDTNSELSEEEEIVVE